METLNTIKKVRTGIGMSQQEFAKALEIDQALVSKYECGKKKTPAEVADKIVKLAKQNKIDVDVNEICSTKSLQDIQKTDKKIHRLKRLINIRRELDEIIDEMRLEEH